MIAAEVAMIVGCKKECGSSAILLLVVLAQLIYHSSGSWLPPAVNAGLLEKRESHFKQQMKGSSILDENARFRREAQQVHSLLPTPSSFRGEVVNPPPLARVLPPAPAYIKEASNHTLSVPVQAHPTAPEQQVPVTQNQPPSTEQPSPQNSFLVPEGWDEFVMKSLFHLKYHETPPQLISPYLTRRPKDSDDIWKMLDWSYAREMGNYVPTFVAEDDVAMKNADKIVFTEVTRKDVDSYTVTDLVMSIVESQFRDGQSSKDQVDHLEGLVPEPGLVLPFHVAKSLKANNAVAFYTKENVASNVPEVNRHAEDFKDYHSEILNPIANIPDRANVHLGVY